ncbi:MAG: hypothetical protein KDK07_13265 [Bauldia sp.]|nr:hypothetical protein [Bauldia sp.]
MRKILIAVAVISMTAAPALAGKSTTTSRPPTGTMSGTVYVPPPPPPPPPRLSTSTNLGSF